MVHTTQIKPSALLQPYIHCYALRQFDTGDDEMPMPLHAMNQCYLTFFLRKSKYVLVTDESGSLQYKMQSALFSLFTSSRGCAHYKGQFDLLSVQFISNGLFAILRIPQRILLNSILPMADILGKDAAPMTEQLENCKDITEMGTYLNAYFTHKLFSQKQKHKTNVIANISNSIFKSKGLVTVDSMASHANMSFRNFERTFIDQVGMSPKLYTRITKFFLAIENKMMYPQKNWTTIAHERGYFDQAHFIRDCKEFSSMAPGELFGVTPPPNEIFIERVDL
jgi:AraC-like DNA-binding protein